MGLSEMRSGIPNTRLVQGIEPNNHEGQLGAEYLNEFNLELCQTESIRNADEFNEYQRQRKAYLHQQQQAQQQHLMSHHQLQNAALSNGGQRGSDEGLGDPQPTHHIIGEDVPGNGIIYSPSEEVMIANGNVRHQLQIVKAMSPCSPIEAPSPIHCSQMPSSPDYRNVNLQEAHTPIMSNGSADRCPDQVLHEGHSGRNMSMWMEGMPSGGIQHLRYDKVRYQNPLDLSSVGSESMEESHWLQRKHEYANCLDSPQLYMAEGLHHQIRTHSRNQSSEGRRTPNLPNPAGISDKQLLDLAVRDLNKLLNGKDRAEIQRIKQKRRTLKNRGYAQNCRMKRVDQRRALEEENRRLRRDLLRLNEHCANLRAENIYLKETLQGLTSCKQQRKYEMSPRRQHVPQLNTNNSNIVLNNNVIMGHLVGGGANNNDGGGPIPSHLNSVKVIEYSESLSIPQTQPIVSSTVKDVRPDGGLPHGNQATPRPDSPEPSNCYWKDER